MKLTCEILGFSLLIPGWLLAGVSASRLNRLYMVRNKLPWIQSFGWKWNAWSERLKQDKGLAKSWLIGTMAGFLGLGLLILSKIPRS